MVHYSLLGCSSDVFQSHPIASPLRRSNPACGEPDRPQKLHHIMSTENPDRIIRINAVLRSEEHTSELQSLMRNSYAVFCLKKKKHNTTQDQTDNNKQTTHYN